ncbi:MAG: hypothetical protein A2162_08180 [Deltaproteobacteria bacterium RBG_13_52_11b]|nr:MAG: hypothetical protein A2162_08180 [Deltaproteobacteria bacterium RBG_13_52_11b]
MAGLFLVLVLFRGPGTVSTRGKAADACPACCRQAQAGPFFISLRRVGQKNVGRKEYEMMTFLAPLARKGIIKRSHRPCRYRETGKEH